MASSRSEQSAAGNHRYEDGGEISIYDDSFRKSQRRDFTATTPLLTAVWLVSVFSVAVVAEDGPRFVQANGRAGTGVMAPGRWTTISCEVVNPTDHPVEVLSTTYFSQQSTLQYGRRIWIPPLSSRTTWYPIQAPSDVEPSVTQWTVRSLLLDTTDGAPSGVISPVGESVYEARFPIAREAATGQIDDGEDDALQDVVRAARVSRRLTKEVFQLHRETMPALPETLEGLDHLVIASDRWQADSAAMVAIRRWLLAGGRLWIMLDQVDPEKLPILLGQHFRCDVIGRVLLDSYQIRDARDVPSRQHGKERVLDDPVELVRVVTAGTEVSHTVNGWPVAFTYPLGKGEVLITTLGAKAWFRPRLSSEARHEDIQKRLSVVATDPLQALAEQFFSPVTEPPLAPDDWRPLVSQSIGYRVVGRSVIGAVLFGFCGILALLGWLLARGPRAAWMGWIGPGLALAAGTILLVIGSNSRTSIPRTTSIGQWIETTEAVNDVRVSGVLAFYNQNEWTRPIGSNGGGIFVPDAVRQSGTTCRMVWTDVDRWHWQPLTLASGVQMAPFTFTTSTPRPVVATATFGAEGLQLNVDGHKAKEMSDAILVGQRQGRLRVRLQENGLLVARSDDVLVPGQYFGNTIVTDRQRRRQSVLQRYFADQGITPDSQPLKLLAWCSAWTTPFMVNDPERLVGDALIALPLRLERPPPGSQVSVPSPLINYRAVPGPDGTLSSAYSPLEQQWVGPLWTSTTCRLRFQLPVEVLPLEVGRAMVSLKINAPGRQLVISAAQEGREVVLAQADSPVGVMILAMDRPEMLQVDETGGLVLTVRVGEHPREDVGTINVVGWQISDLALQVDGVVGTD